MAPLVAADWTLSGQPGNVPAVQALDESETEVIAVKWKRTREWIADFLLRDDAPEDALAFFAESEDWLLRARVTANRRAPVQLLKTAADDPDPRVRRAAAERPPKTTGTSHSTTYWRSTTRLATRPRQPCSAP
jgi:hypothetical protein